MATAIDLVNKALYLSGASSQVNPATPELKNMAFDALVDMLNEWEALGIVVTGLTIPTNLTDELANPTDTNQVIQYQLAVLSSPLFQIDAPFHVKSKAASLYTDFLTKYMPYPAPEWPNTLTVGAGNERGPHSRVFYPVPDTDS